MKCALTICTALLLSLSMGCTALQLETMQGKTKSFLSTVERAQPLLNKASDKIQFGIVELLNLLGVLTLGGLQLALNRKVRQADEKAQTSHDRTTKLKREMRAKT